MIYEVMITEEELRLFSEFLEQREYNNSVLVPDKIIMPTKNVPSVLSQSPSAVSTVAAAPKIPNPALQGKVSSLRGMATMKNMAGKGALLAGGLAATALAVNAFKPKKEK